jgi:D-aminopeptidase
LPPPETAPAPRCRARDLGIAPGIFRPGAWNAITDVPGVRVGQVTLIEGESVRTGVTAILPHGGNPYQERVPAGLAVLNGYGKLAGATQLEELGEIETPILLTNTLAVGRVVEAVVDWTLGLPGNEVARSVNAVVGETNDGRLNDIRRRGVTAAHALEALSRATEGPVAEGAVGAGTGTMAFGWKGGIGTASRLLPPALGSFAVGVLAQTNFGGALMAGGVPLGRELGQFYLRDHADRGDADGSVMLVVATDAPLSDRNLKRLAMRAGAGLARTGAAFSDGSGDYTIAFSTHLQVRRLAGATVPRSLLDLPNDRMSPLFVAVAEAAEEAILNSLFMASTVTARDLLSGRRITGRAIDLEAVRGVLARFGRG